MRILIASDAWSPQVNGVVRSLQSLAANARKLEAEIEFLTPEGFRTFPLPTYPTIRCGIPSWREIARRIEFAAPDALHIATEGPIGHSVRRYCLARKNSPYNQLHDPFSGIRFGAAAGPPVMELCGVAPLSRGRRGDDGVDPLIARGARHRGFAHLATWTRGVDTDLVRPERAAALDLPRPIFVSVGRLAVEKNLAAFLALDLPGSKVVFGDGPQAGELQRRFPNTHFLGQMEGETSAAHIAAGRHAHRTPVAPGTASGLDDGIEGVPRSHTFADHWPIGRRRPMRYLSSEDRHVP